MVQFEKQICYLLEQENPRKYLKTQKQFKRGKKAIQDNFHTKPIKIIS